MLWHNVLIVFATLVLVPTALGQDRPRTFADSVGVNVKFTQGQPMSGLKLLTELGVRWVRDTAAWPDIEPSAGRYVGFPKPFVDRLAFYKKNDIGVVFGLWYNNAQAYPPTPQAPGHDRNPEAYGRYAAEVAKLLKASGVRFVIELYNEPHNTMKDLGGAWNGTPPAAWLDQYVAMVHAATRAVKAVDPAVHVVAGDDMWVLHYRFLEKGLPAEVDALAVHPYVSSWPEFSATEPDTTWARPFVTVDADRSLFSAVRRLRDHATEKLGRTPAIWITEWGWPLGQPIHDRQMTEELLAGMIPRAYLTAADAGVEALLWFSIQDSVDGPMGLTANDGQRRRTFDALKVMVQQLGKTTTRTHVEGATYRTSGLQVYRLGGVGMPSVFVAWNIDGDIDVTVSDATKMAAIDVFGKAVPVKQVDGASQLTLGRSPLYLTGLAESAQFTLVKQAGRDPTYLFGK